MTDLVTIDLDEERGAVAKLYATWQRALAEKQDTIRYASEHKVAIGDGYWQAEAKARAKWVAAANFVEMLEEARRRC